MSVQDRITLAQAYPFVETARPNYQQQLPIDQERVEALKAIQTRNEGSILGLPGVVGIGIGLTEDGKDLAFIIYVEKLTSAIKSEVAERIDGVPVRIIESGVFKSY